MPDIIVVGGAAYDYLAHGPELPTPERSVHGDTFIKAPGGKGFNQAIAAARLGGRVTFVSRVGIDAEGDAIMAALTADGVDVRFVGRGAETATAAVLIHVDAQGRKQTMAVPGANNRLSVEDIEAAADVLRDGRVLLMQLEVPAAALVAARRLASRARHVLDPAPVGRMPEGFLDGIDVVKPNAVEALAYSGVCVTDRASGRAAADVLRAKGAAAVVVGGAGPGVLLLDKTGEHYLAHHDVPVVDTTGAGDAMAAAIAVGLAEHGSLRDAVRLGVAAAAVKATRIGAYGALPTRNEVEALLERSRGQRG